MTTIVEKATASTTAPTMATTTTTTDMTKDATETSLGICAYLSPTVPGFSGVLKGRFSDFLVHEVGLDGTKAELTSVEDATIGTTDADAPNIPQETEKDKGAAPDASPSKGQQEDTTDRKRKREDGDVGGEGGDGDDAKPSAIQKKNDDSSSINWEMLRMELSKLLTNKNDDGTGKGDDADESSCATDVIQFVQNEPDSQRKYVCIPASSDKQRRRALHEWIRSSLAGHALADTADENGIKVIRVWNPKFAPEMSNYGKFKNDNSSPRRASSQPTAKFIRFVLYKENLDTNSALKQIQSRSGGGGGGGGRRGKRHHHQALRLGFAGMKDKRGITSQFITMPARRSVESLLRSVNPRAKCGNDEKTGGGHTDGAGTSVLRIGNFVYVDEDLRLGRLRGNRFDIVLRNIFRPADDSLATKEILAQAARSLGTAGFINYFGIQRFGKFCDTHLVGIAILKKDFAKAVDLILQPKPDERENTSKARQEWQERFAKVASDAPEKAKAAAEKECAKRIVRDFGRFMNNEVAILKSLAERPLDYRRAIGSVTKTMRMMFVHAVQSLLFNHAATFRLQEIGEKVVEGDLVPDGPLDSLDAGIPKVRRVTSDDIQQNRFTLEDIFLPLLGSKCIEPDNDTAKIYTNVLKEHGLTRESFDIKDRDFNCAGDYRRLIVRPSDVDYDLIDYTDPRQPLVQTDLMKLQGIAIKPASSDSDSPLLAMRVGFTLPSSAYATIALREMMKRPTSTDYQKDLSLS